MAGLSRFGFLYNSKLKQESKSQRNGSNGASLSRKLQMFLLTPRSTILLINYVYILEDKGYKKASHTTSTFAVEVYV